MSAEQRPERLESALGRTGFVLSLAVSIGVPILLAALVGAASPFVGAAIDSYDENILEPAERASLTVIASVMGWTFLVGTILGTAALVIGMLTRRTGTLATATIVLSCAAPVLSVLISFWIVAAAGSPDYIDG